MEAGVVYDELVSIPDDSAASIYRLYSAYFLRCPDPRGFAYWANHEADGHELVGVSNGFAGSDEFKLTYGDSLPDDEFVELVYGRVLGPTPDGDGKNYWLEQLGLGMSRGDVMLQFSDSNDGFDSGDLDSS